MGRSQESEDKVRDPHALDPLGDGDLFYVAAQVAIGEISRRDAEDLVPQLQAGERFRDTEEMGTIKDVKVRRLAVDTIRLASEVVCLRRVTNPAAAV